MLYSYKKEIHISILPFKIFVLLHLLRIWLSKNVYVICWLNIYFCFYFFNVKYADVSWHYIMNQSCVDERWSSDSLQWFWVSDAVEIRLICKVNTSTSKLVREWKMLWEWEWIWVIENNIFFPYIVGALYMKKCWMWRGSRSVVCWSRQSVLLEIWNSLI